MKRSTPLHLALTLIVSLMICHCGSDSGEIKIGVIQAQTGMYAGFGTGGLFGIQAAAEDINKLGGVDIHGTKMPVRLIIVDNESDPNKAGLLAQSLVVRDNVDFILSGDEPPPMHPAISTVCDRYEIPYVTSAGPFEPWVAMRNETDTKWPYTWATGLFAIATPPEAPDFRAGMPGYTVNDYWVDILVRYGDQIGKNVAVFASDDSDGIGWYRGLSQMLKPNGFEPMGYEKNLGLLPTETTDFSSVINEWKAGGAQVLWGNCPAPFFGALWKQCRALGFKPKMVSVSRAPLFYQDIRSWGGDLPLGVCVEIWWNPSITEYQGIGNTTPLSLVERWKNETGQPVNPAIGPGYRAFQVLVDAVSRAKSIEGKKVNDALASTDLMTLGHRVKFDKNHFNRSPLYYGQWQKADTPEGWKLEVIYSKHAFVPETSEPLFPIPY